MNKVWKKDEDDLDDDNYFNDLEILDGNTLKRRWDRWLEMRWIWLMLGSRFESLWLLFVALDYYF